MVTWSSCQNAALDTIAADWPDAGNRRQDRGLLAGKVGWSPRVSVALFPLASDTEVRLALALAMVWRDLAGRVRIGG